MAELFKNPLVSVTLLAVCDVIGILAFIIYTVKKQTETKKLKKIIPVIAGLVLIDILFSFLIISSNSVYDRNGKRYFSSDEITYYDIKGKSYHISRDDELRSHLVSDDGIQMYIADRVYIDKDGYIVYDRTNTFKKKDKEYVYYDSEGNEYFSIADIKWKKNGEIKIIPNE